MWIALMLRAAVIGNGGLEPRYTLGRDNRVELALIVVGVPRRDARSLRRLSHGLHRCVNRLQHKTGGQASSPGFPGAPFSKGRARFKSYPLDLRESSHRRCGPRAWSCTAIAFAFSNDQPSSRWAVIPVAR